MLVINMNDNKCVCTLFYLFVVHENHILPTNINSFISIFMFFYQSNGSIDPLEFFGKDLFWLHNNNIPENKNIIDQPNVYTSYCNKIVFIYLKYIFQTFLSIFICSVQCSMSIPFILSSIFPFFFFLSFNTWKGIDDKKNEIIEQARIHLCVPVI